MKVVVDRELCQTHAACTGDAPDVFDLRDGELVILQEHPPESLREDVETAAKYCPTGAISIVEDDADA